jgi:hypothetical protein
MSPLPWRPTDGSHRAARTGPEPRACVHLTEQIGTATHDLTQLRDRGVHAQRVPAPHAGQR